jgi:hypothetical protein
MCVGGIGSVQVRPGQVEQYKGRQNVMGAGRLDRRGVMRRLVVVRRDSTQHGGSAQALCLRVIESLVLLRFGWAHKNSDGERAV